LRSGCECADGSRRSDRSEALLAGDSDAAARSVLCAGWWSVGGYRKVPTKRKREREYRAAMSSSGEFSTLSSGEATGTGEDSLPSSREATAEAAVSGSGFVPLREFLDRFSLPRVVRVEGAGGRPILLYKQQQRSLRVTATLLMHRYRHDVKVGPEIVIPEGYPGEYTIRYTARHVFAR